MYYHPRVLDWKIDEIPLTDNIHNYPLELFRSNFKHHQEQIVLDHYKDQAITDKTVIVINKLNAINKNYTPKQVLYIYLWHKPRIDCKICEIQCELFSPHSGFESAGCSGR